MMQKDWLTALKTADPQIRRRAIIEMANAMDPDALKILKFLYEHDRDASNRELAKKAALHLWHSLQNPQVDDALVEEEAAPAKEGQPENKEIPPAEFQPEAEPILQPQEPQTEKARIYLNRALASVVKTDEIGAQKSLMQAFLLNPSLMDDKIAGNLASELTGLPPQEAIQALRQKQARSMSNKTGTDPATEGQTPKKPWRIPLIAGLGFVVLIFILLLGFKNLQARGLIGYQQVRHTVNGFTYYLIPPRGEMPEGGWPVVAALHGYGGSGEDMLSFANPFSREGIVYLCPTFGEYLPDPGNGPIEPMAAILDEVHKAYPIQQKGVVLLGYSQGGSFAYRFSILQASRVAGVVTAGAPHLDALQPASRTKPYVFTWGANDGLQDFVVPASVTPLINQGYQVTYTIIPDAGHVVTPEAISLAIEMALK
jgi:predicted esterase